MLRQEKICFWALAGVSVSELAREWGYCELTIRKYLKAGGLVRVLQQREHSTPPAVFVRLNPRFWAHQPPSNERSRND